MLAHIDVDLAAVRRNVAALKALAAPARFASVVKANAYGHGLAGVGRALAADVDLLCVYRVEEGHVLRDAGLDGPILVLGPIAPQHLSDAIDGNFAITLWDAGAYFSDVARIVRSRGRRLPIHVKVDTGTTRFGLRPSDVAAAIDRYRAEPALDIAGIFTHLAAVEELESGFTALQAERFDGVLQAIAPITDGTPIVRHAAASAATMLYPTLRLDLVRVGIATYGLWPSPATESVMSKTLALEPALAFKTELVAVQDVPAGTSVGYGCTFRTERASRIGVLPVGYAEGVPRAASNRGAVLLGGRRAPIVGRVCMNVTMVDVTDIPAAHSGATVTLIGRDGDERIAADEWGTWCDTIAYEIVARLPSEVPRRYRGDDEIRAPFDSEPAALRSG